MPFIYPRTIYFHDTDAAGVVYFANILSICHEAYEASLIASEIELRSFFGNVAIAIPITHASADFLAPMFCGDRIEIHLTPAPIRDQKFRISYQILAVDSLDRILAKAVTEHICIDRSTRRQQILPPEMQQWMQQFH